MASRTAGPGASRTSASLYHLALSVSTKLSSYLDKAGQKVEAAINRAAWGKDYDGTPAGPKGKVHLKSTGATGVGKTAAATPSTWFEDVKSFYKLREAGVTSDDALKIVNQSGEELKAAGATPTRVPQAPRSAPSALKAGATLSIETNPASVATEVGWGSKIATGIGAALGVLGSFAGGYQVGTGGVQISEGKTGEGVTTMAEGTANLGLTIGTTAAVNAKLVVAEQGIVASGLTFLAGIAAAGAVALAGEETRRTIRGEQTMASEAVDYWNDVQERAVSEGPSVGGALTYVGAEIAGGITGFIASGQDDLWGLL